MGKTYSSELQNRLKEAQVNANEEVKQKDSFKGKLAVGAGATAGIAGSAVGLSFAGLAVTTSIIATGGIAAIALPVILIPAGIGSAIYFWKRKPDSSCSIPLSLNIR